MGCADRAALQKNAVSFVGYCVFCVMGYQDVCVYLDTIFFPS